MKLCYLPIDSRPCNARFPGQLLAAAGIPCVMPPEEAMDCFTRPSDDARVWRFLTEATKDADTLILSADKLAYGSLLASREDDVGEDEAVDRVLRVGRLKAANPRLRVIAFTILLRSSISTLKASDVAWHHLVTQYSQACHRAKVSGDTADQAEVSRLEAAIPERVLTKYRNVRRRNLAVNRACVSLVRQGAIDDLLILQEDSQPLGLHKLEQQVLSRDIDDAIRGRVTVHNGTDEGGCLCAALAAAPGLKLHVRALGGDDLSFVAKYEDRPFSENIDSHMRFAKMLPAQLEDADKVLCVLTPGGAPQRDIEHPMRETAEELARFDRLARELADLLKTGKPVGLLDVCYANGGAVRFFEALAKHVSPLALTAYAAWNTASNSLGTVLSQLALGRDGAQNRAFTAERLLDDLLYQGAARGPLQARLVAAGEDPYHLKDKETAERLLQSAMRDAVSESPVFGGYAVEATYTLPWPRTFEAAIAVRALSRGKE